MTVKLIKLLLPVFLSLQLSAQEISLQVSVSTTIKNDSLPGATLQLYTLPDTLLLLSQTAQSKGNVFLISPLKSYLLKASAIGYEAIDTIISTKDKSFNLVLHFKKTLTALSGVVVTARKQLLKQEDDKTIVDATVLANSSTNAYEVLEKTPGAVIDQDGNVYLSSTSPATVFINGREMKISSTDLASLLKSLPAGSVSKIEILRNPSAKYDAASSGGIVNIVLKKGVKLGSNGSFNLGYFQGVYGTQTGGLNINKSAGKINSYFSYQFTRRNNFEALNSERFIRTDTSVLTQKAYTTYPSLNNYFSGGIDVVVSKNSVLITISG